MKVTKERRAIPRQEPLGVGEHNVTVKAVHLSTFPQDIRPVVSAYTDDGEPVHEQDSDGQDVYSSQRVNFLLSDGNKAHWASYVFNLFELRNLITDDMTMTKALMIFIENCFAGMKNCEFDDETFVELIGKELQIELVQTMNPDGTPMLGKRGNELFRIRRTRAVQPVK